MKINKPHWIINHHEGANNGFEKVNQWHRINPKTWLGEYSALGFAIAYHYYISKNGEVHQGRLDREEGAHCHGLNTQSIGICLQGNFSKELPTEAQRTALRRLLVEKMRKYDIPLKRIVGHRFFASTECPGKNLSDDWARKLASQETQKYDEKQLKIKLLKTQIGLIEKIIQFYVKWLEKLKGRNN